MPTGERVNEDPKDSNFALHVYRYLWAMRFALDRTVLDAGCGSGYGSVMLATIARSVVGVDRDTEVISRNLALYSNHTNLRFQVGNVLDLPFPDDSFDLIVTFEVFEHLTREESGRFLSHLWRLCTADGVVLISTPNRLVEAPFMKGAGHTNPYHVNSVSPSQLKEQLRPFFTSIQLFGQRQRAPFAKRTLKFFDLLNLRHRIIPAQRRRGLDQFLNGGTVTTPLSMDRIEIRHSLVRQSGILIAVCKA